jgi:hypothetical protein
MASMHGAAATIRDRMAAIKMSIGGDAYNVAMR